MDGYKEPFPFMTPAVICNTLLPPPPIPASLECYLSQQENGNIKKNSFIIEMNRSVNSSPVQLSVPKYNFPQEGESSLNNNDCNESSFNKTLLNSHAYSSSSHCETLVKKDLKTKSLNDKSEINVSSLYSYKQNLGVLTSSENMQLNYSKSEEIQKIEYPPNQNGALTMVFDSPLSKSSSKTETTPVFTPTSLKRSYSLCAGSSTSDNNFTPKRKYENSEDKRYGHCMSSTSRNTPLTSRWRRSLPIISQKEKFSNNKAPNSYRSKSLQLKYSPYPSSPLTYRSCNTDQTPYEVEDSIQQRKRIKTTLPYYNASELVTLKSKYGFIDSHCHLDFLFQRQGYSGTYADYKKNHEDTFPASYQGCLAIFCNPSSFSQKWIWEKYLKEENVWASFGCHPHNAKNYDDDVHESLCTALEHPKVRALGEIGLDYSNRNNCKKDEQFKAFERQLKLALEKQLPVVIHCREAHEDGMAIMKKILPKNYLIHLHCFTDTWEWAEKWLDEFPNLFIGITNVVTFPSAESVHEVAKNIPLKRLLLETDAPYFVPRAMPRGTKFSHPGMAIHVAAQIATLKDVPLEKVLKRTRKNTKRIYNI